MKKAFFDGWDHLFAVLLLNLGFAVLAALGLFLPGLVGGGAVGFYATLAALGLLASVWWSASVLGLKNVADYANLEFKAFPAILKKALVPGLQYWALNLVVVIALGIGIPFYLSKGGIVGALAAGLLLWGSVVFILAFQWYLPLRARFGGGFRKNLRKCFVFFFDNGLFSLFVFLHGLVGAAISLVLALIMPGFAGIALGLDSALRLRAYKYDWLEANPGAKRGDIPWEELLAEEKELVGHRTLKNMIFPWKD